MLRILEVTPSVKTRIAIIRMISPRLTDPKSESEAILNLFRYSEEKTQVEEALKARAKAIEKSRYSAAPKASIPGSNTPHGVRPGRGRGGRGLTTSSSARPTSAPMEFTSPINGSNLFPLSMSNESFSSAHHIQQNSNESIHDHLVSRVTDDEPPSTRPNGHIKSNGIHHQQPTSKSDSINSASKLYPVPPPNPPRSPIGPATSAQLALTRAKSQSDVNRNETLTSLPETMKPIDSAPKSYQQNGNESNKLLQQEIDKFVPRAESSTAVTDAPAEGNNTYPAHPQRSASPQPYLLPSVVKLTENDPARLRISPTMRRSDKVFRPDSPSQLSHSSQSRLKSSGELGHKKSLSFGPAPADALLHVIDPDQATVEDLGSSSSSVIRNALIPKPRFSQTGKVMDTICSVSDYDADDHSLSATTTDAGSPTKVLSSVARMAKEKEEVSLNRMPYLSQVQSVEIPANVHVPSLLVHRDVIPIEALFDLAEDWQYKAKYEALVDCVLTPNEEQPGAGSSGFARWREVADDHTLPSLLSDVYSRNESIERKGTGKRTTFGIPPPPRPPATGKLSQNSTAPVSSDACWLLRRVCSLSLIVRYEKFTQHKDVKVETQRGSSIDAGNVPHPDRFTSSLKENSEYLQKAASDRNGLPGKDETSLETGNPSFDYPTMSPVLTLSNTTLDAVLSSQSILDGNPEGTANPPIYSSSSSVTTVTFAQDVSSPNAVSSASVPSPITQDILLNRARSSPELRASGKYSRGGVAPFESEGRRVKDGASPPQLSGDPTLTSRTTPRQSPLQNAQPQYDQSSTVSSSNTTSETQWSDHELSSSGTHISRAGKLSYDSASSGRIVSGESLRDATETRLPSPPTANARRADCDTSEVDVSVDSNGNKRRRSITAVSDAKLVGSRREQFLRAASTYQMVEKGFNVSPTNTGNRSVSGAFVRSHIPPSMGAAPTTKHLTAIPVAAYPPQQRQKHQRNHTKENAIDLPEVTGWAEAYVLGMDLTDFLAMKPNGPKGWADGFPYFEYSELVRRNFTKQYEGLKRTELEEHLTDDDFERVFEMTKVGYIIYI